ncbi:MAG: ATPase P [Desulfobacterales bacterium]|uniref:ATPase P n=1 Tax=Candidatus Desulfaltia bathyphila TaxID=2841697 RepID=A0A8J6N7E1_9BACT|nr:ATPase P [Candidatus Desulfaltia bathyphila]MBL7195841.1 ATPase P [Desulfobacterales bacterium]MBL7207634.1 ATPase P [Desulfobacterales bacterium]
MIEIDIPGFGILRLEHLVLDYNGTIAVDGQPVQGVKERLIALARHVEIHVLTADTFGGVKKKLSDIPCKIHVLPVEAQDKGKMEYIDRLADRAVCIGNGRNDVMMLKKAALGIAVVQDEGAAASAVLSADIVVTDILFALDLITNHMRLTATLRS